LLKAQEACLMIDSYLRQMKSQRASDLFLCCGKPPALRIDGQLTTLSEEPILVADFNDFIDRILSTPQQKRYLEDGDLDVGYSLDEDRYRLNLHRQSGQMALVARVLPGGDLSLSDLGLPEILEELALRPRGLLLITGATGSGKSTTAAALVHAINRQRSAHVVTVEDPIEFVHRDLRSRISQREVGVDTKSFASALRHIVRESPDVIVIGEMRDAETVEVALAAAMTGHLVLSTMHTIDAGQSVQRLLGLFPEGQRRQVCLDLSMSLIGIASQRLLPLKDGNGRVVAAEVLRFTPGASQLLAEGRTDELGDLMRTSRDPGIIPFNQALLALYKREKISLETGLAYSNNPDEFRLAAIGMRTGVDGFAGEGDAELLTRSDMQALLDLAMVKKASDVHLSVGRPPIFRVAGQLQPVGHEPLTSADVRWLLFSILSGRQRSQLELDKELDFSLRLESGVRFRVNAYFQKGHLAVALRLIHSKIPTPEELGLPAVLTTLLDKPQGLILVVGPTGSGKTTTVASLVDQINQSRTCHIVTVEDPIEYSYESDKSSVDQREVYSDTKSFASALKYILRQDPDVIVVGEMRDLETISSVLTAAETGHLVFATLHTNDAASTIDRIVDVFPSHQQAQIRVQLAACLLAIVSQRLLPTEEEKRVAAFEVLIATSAVRALVREGKTHQLATVMQTSRNHGMNLLDRSLVDLVKEGKVQAHEAARFMLDPKFLETQMEAHSREVASANDPIPEANPKKGLGGWFRSQQPRES
jgi:twitching motility protein PilT